MTNVNTRATQCRMFEDFETGTVFDLGERTVSKEEIIAFASHYDPQPFHLEEEAGNQSILGGLAASGWHTSSMMMRMFYDALLTYSSSLGAPGIDRVSWLKPVRAGDRLSGSMKVLETRASNSKPELGFVRFLMRAENQHGAPVYEQTFSVMFGKRDVG